MNEERELLDKVQSKLNSCLLRIEEIKNLVENQPYKTVYIYKKLVGLSDKIAFINDDINAYNKDGESIDE